jgi:hypothetical protein
MRGISPGGSYFPAKAELIGIRLSYQFGNRPVSLGTAASCLVGPSLSRRLRRIRAVFRLQSFG